MTPLGVAMDARALVTRGWTQFEPTEHAYARDAQGRPVGHLSSQAAKWTLAGALLRATDTPPGAAPTPQAQAVFDALSTVVGAKAGEWSNTAGRTQREVIAAFDAVVRQLEAA